MHIREIDTNKFPATIAVKFLIEDAEGMGLDRAEIDLKAPRTRTLLELALEHGINIEHACGGVCACSTCHVHVEKGMSSLTEATEAEEDRVEEAPGIKRTSRLSCQCEIHGKGPIIVRVPAWNRNAIKEIPH